MSNKPNAHFVWEGIDKNGCRIKGELEAVDQEVVKSILEHSGIILLKIKKKPIALWKKFKNEIKKEHITFFIKELSVLISAHVSLVNALDMVEKNTKKTSLKKLIFNIRQRIMNGESFSSVLKSYPLYFNGLCCSLVEAGEHCGKLDVVFNNIAEYAEKDTKFKYTIKKALFYPITILMVSLLVTGALLVFIVPQFDALFQNVGAQLPWLTQLMISLSHLIYKQGIFWLAIIIISLAFVKIQFKRSRKWKFFLDKLFLRIPLFGKILCQSILSRSFSTLAILLRSGIPLTEALSLVERISNNAVYQNAFRDVLEKITAGYAIHESMKQVACFPENTIRLIAVGEMSGTLEDILKGLGEYFQEKVDHIAQNLSQMLEPAIMIFLSIIVGTVIIAMYLPIFKLGTVV